MSIAFVNFTNPKRPTAVPPSAAKIRMHAAACGGRTRGRLNGCVDNAFGFQDFDPFRRIAQNLP
jgi:hypothetical protein